jgi:uncharacterized membrane protein YoaK (UPF0700 family)
MRKLFTNLRNNPINSIKLALFVLAVVLILLDIYFAVAKTSENVQKFPTFSATFKTYQTKALWFVFTLGCLVGKIFYNKTTHYKYRELKGLVTIAIINLFLIIIATKKDLFINNDVPNWLTMSLFAIGMAAAALFWPQYKKF